MSCFNSDETAPTATELELTVFGRGVGECIVVHAGRGQWIIIDSCQFPDDSSPVSLRYLQSLGVDPAAGVIAVVATHWHDDHIHGLSEVVAACKAASFFMSAALQAHEFARLALGIDNQSPLIRTSSTATEFAEILRVLGARVAGRMGSPPISVQEGTVIHRVHTLGEFSCIAHGISPSPSVVLRANQRLADLLVDQSQRFRDLNPNDLSVAILLETPVGGILLGADLESTNDPCGGWGAVLASKRLPRIKSSSFKVPHHGSDNGHHDGIWSDWLFPNPIAVVTPYAKGVKPLPSPADVRRLVGLTSEAYTTGIPKSQAPGPRRGVDGFVAPMTRTRTVIRSDPGRITVRWDAGVSGASPNVRLFGAATKLH